MTVGNFELSASTWLSCPSECVRKGSKDRQDFLAKEIHESAKVCSHENKNQGLTAKVSSINFAVIFVQRKFLPLKYLPLK